MTKHAQQLVQYVLALDIIKPNSIQMQHNNPMTLPNN